MTTTARPVEVIFWQCSPREDNVARRVARRIKRHACPRRSFNQQQARHLVCICACHNQQRAASPARSCSEV